MASCKVNWKNIQKLEKIIKKNEKFFIENFSRGDISKFNLFCTTDLVRFHYSDNLHAMEWWLPKNHIPKIDSEGDVNEDDECSHQIEAKKKKRLIICVSGERHPI